MVGTSNQSVPDMAVEFKGKVMGNSKKHGEFTGNP